MQNIEKKVWFKFLVVFLYHGFGSVLPLGLTYLEQNPSWLILIPIIKAGWESLEHYLRGRQLIGSAKYH